MFGPPKAPKVKGIMHPRFDEILTPEALAFVAKLDGAACRPPRRAAGRPPRARQAHRRRRAGRLPGRDRRASATTPAGRSRRRRRAWRTGAARSPARPTRKMSINALNSGAKVWMADFEDATAPSWSNVIDGQLNLYRRDPREPRLHRGGRQGVQGRRGHAHHRGAPARLAAVREAPEHRRPAAARPRWSTSGCTSSTTRRQLIDSGAGPYFYLPKLESHLEARLWNDVFVQAQALLGIPQGTIRATVLIETLPAAFEMEEILYELRDHSSGLNAGRWDYIFSYIKTFAAPRRRVRAAGPRADVTMTTPFMRAYTELLVSTCHRRGAHAIGGMAAFVPNKADPAGHRAGAGQGEGGQGARGRRRLRRLLGGAPRPGADLHDGVRPRCSATGRTSWTSSVRTCTSPPPTCSPSARRPGTVTLAGLRTNISVALRYLTAWVSGRARSPSTT